MLGAARDRAGNSSKAPRRGPSYGEPGPGRPKGSKSKLTKEGLLAAREAFAPINEKALTLMERHLDFHLAAQEKIVDVLVNGHVEDLAVLLQLNEDLMRGDCATCRHILTLSSEYTYGKPVQRQELRIEDVREEARRLAGELGIDPDVAVREAEEILRGRH